MKNILHLFKRDVQNVSRSVIGLVVVMGLIIVPCLYAWFNIAGSWDPYGNTGNLKIAVVNTDEGYESDLIPVEVNVGENVTATLRGNESFDWVVLNDRDKAIEGVKSGAYYAAVVIPKTFSADMMTLFSTDVKHADIEFYENQKANAIAQIVTEKGSSAVQNQVNESFTETITSVGLKTVSSLLDYMSTDQVSNLSPTCPRRSAIRSRTCRTFSQRNVACGHFELHGRFADVGGRHAQAVRIDRGVGEAAHAACRERYCRFRASAQVRQRCDRCRY